MHDAGAAEGNRVVWRRCHGQTESHQHGHKVSAYRLNVVFQYGVQKLGPKAVTLPVQLWCGGGRLCGRSNKYRA